MDAHGTNMCSLWYARNDPSGTNFSGRDICRPWYAPIDTEKNLSVVTARDVDTLTVISSSIVINPLSNALSCSAESSKPFLGFILLDSSWLQGTMWLATSSVGVESPVIQHRRLYALMTAALKKRCPIRVVASAIRSSPMRLSSSSSSSDVLATEPTIASTASIVRCDSTAKRAQSLCISSHIARSLADAFLKPARPEDVMVGSRLAMLVSFIDSAPGVRPIASANRVISGFLEWSWPKGNRQ